MITSKKHKNYFKVTQRLYSLLYKNIAILLLWPQNLTVLHNRSENYSIIFDFYSNNQSNLNPHLAVKFSTKNLTIISHHKISISLLLFKTPHTNPICINFATKHLSKRHPAPLITVSWISNALSCNLITTEQSLNNSKRIASNRKKTINRIMLKCYWIAIFL